MKVWLVLFGILLELDHTLVRVLLENKQIQKGKQIKPKATKFHSSQVAVESIVGKTLVRTELLKLLTFLTILLFSLPYMRSREPQFFT